MGDHRLKHGMVWERFRVGATGWFICTGLLAMAWVLVRRSSTHVSNEALADLGIVVGLSVAVALHHLWRGSGRLTGFVLSGTWIWVAVHLWADAAVGTNVPTGLLGAIVLMPTAAMIIGP
ncbi:MAG: hypothetical protein AB7V43_12890 [Acidimicrobiia bacterium]